MRLHKLIPFVELFSKGLSFLGILLISRMVSVESFGVYYYVISIVAWSSVIMDGGVSYYVINKSIKDDIDDIGSLLSYRLLFSILTVLGIIVVFIFLKANLLIELTLYSLSFVAILMTGFFKVVSRTQGFLNVDFLTVITEPLIRILLLVSVFTFYSTLALNQIFLILFISAIIAFLVCYISFLKKVSFKFNFRFSVSGMSKVLRETKYFMLMYLFLVGFKRVEILLVDYKFSDQITGLFSSADNFYSSAYLFFTSLILVGIKNYMAYENHKKMKYFVGFFMLLIATILIINLGAEIFFSLLYDSAYHEGSQYFKTMSFSLLFSPFVYILILKNNYNHQTKQNFWALAFGFVFKILLLIVSKNINQFLYMIILSDLILLGIFLIQNQRFKKTHA